jgi:hypothetical protein
MGTKQTKEEYLGKGHPQRFYDACDEMQKGSYTVAEIYFNQAIDQHPGNAFWTGVMDVAVTERSNSEQRRSPTTQHRPSCENGLPQSRRDADTNRTVAIFHPIELKQGLSRSSTVQNAVSSPTPKRTTLENLHSPLQHTHTPAVLPRVTEEDEKDVRRFEFPVDRSLVDAQSFVRMLTDISRIYRRKASTSTGDSLEMARRLSMFYNAYTAVRLQAMLHLFQSHFALHNTTGDRKGEDMFGLYCKRRTQGQFSMFRSKAAHSKDSSVQVNVTPSSEVQSQKRHSGIGVHWQNDAVCVFWEFVQFYWAVNVLLYVTTALRLLRAADGSVMPPSNAQTVFDMAVKCFKAVENQLLLTAEVNAHMYIGELMRDFIGYLRGVTNNCASRESNPAPVGNRNAPAAHIAEAAFLRLSSPNFGNEQSTFLRLAKHFNMPSVPLLDETTLNTVQLEMQFQASHHRSAKLMTPLDRNYGWFLSPDFDRRSSTPGHNTYLLQKCGVPASGSERSWALFTSAGLEEMSIVLLPIALGSAIILRGRNKRDQFEEVTSTTVKFALDMYGGPTPVSDLVTLLFREIDNNVGR